MNNTYHVSGILRKEICYEIFRTKSIYREVDAPNEQSATDFFEIDGWKFAEDGPTVWHVTEAVKMERAGQPTLFPLSEGRC